MWIRVWLIIFFFEFGFCFWLVWFFEFFFALLISSFSCILYFLCCWRTILDYWKFVENYVLRIIFNKLRGGYKVFLDFFIYSHRVGIFFFFQCPVHWRGWEKLRIWVFWKRWGREGDGIWVFKKIFRSPEMEKIGLDRRKREFGVFYKTW